MKENRAAGRKNSKAFIVERRSRTRPSRRGNTRAKAQTSRAARPPGSTAALADVAEVLRSGTPASALIVYFTGEGLDGARNRPDAAAPVHPLDDGEPRTSHDGSHGVRIAGHWAMSAIAAAPSLAANSLTRRDIQPASSKLHASGRCCDSEHAGRSRLLRSTRRSVEERRLRYESILFGLCTTASRCLNIQHIGGRGADLPRETWSRGSKCGGVPAPEGRDYRRKECVAASGNLRRVSRGRTLVPLATMTARSIACSSSRTLPGQL